MKHQRGMSSLGLVLLIMLLGSVMLSGLNQRQQTHHLRVVSESRALRTMAEAQSAMEWGRVQPWQSRPAVQCRQSHARDWRACLRIFDDQTLLLIAASGGHTLWRLGAVENDRVTFSRHGWSDFCPFTGEALCQLP